MFLIVRLRDEGSAQLNLSKTEEKKNAEKGRRSSTIMRLFWGSSSPPRQGTVECVLFVMLEAFTADG